MVRISELYAELNKDYSPSSEQLRFIKSFLALYESLELIRDSRDEPLCEACCNRGPCWAGAPRRDAEWDQMHGGIAVPWVGRHYAESRICVIGMNFDNGGGLAEHWRVCADHNRVMHDGGLGKGGRFFATGAMSYAWAVHLAMSGSPLDSWKEPRRQALAEMWDHCAFLQAVKCAPGGKRSSPTDEMCNQCPRFLLEKELEILSPKAVILLGRSSLRDIVRPMLSVQWGLSRPGGHLEQDTFKLAGNDHVQLFSCNHPSTNNRKVWLASLCELVDVLKDRKLWPSRGLHDDAG